ncbi:hypothetical protein CJ030_MR6G005336 [Morella rubra]|uniref:Uncharacterized protein n=1 Tax=Morella rubra TaxID=262757 RepID=A0A6A1VAR6_9ROSI|nr:hypothetical protein CJ030_MR6G005336 [Morella rubra]
MSRRAASFSSASDGNHGGVALVDSLVHYDSRLFFCELKARMRTSTTKGNPGRRFFGCSRYSSSLVSICFWL